MNEILIGSTGYISAFNDIWNQDERGDFPGFFFFSLPPLTEVRWDGVCERRASTTGFFQHHSFKPNMTEPQWPEVRQSQLQNITATKKLFDFSGIDIDIIQKLIMSFTKLNK